MAGLILQEYKCMALALFLVICCFGVLLSSIHMQSFKDLNSLPRTEGTLSFFGAWRLGQKSLGKPLILGELQRQQLSKQLRKIASRWLCWRSFIVNAGGIGQKFSLSDSNTLLSNLNFTNAEGHTYDWRGIGILEIILQT
ncbi:hypothetical protein NC651_033401 [Populus alba x Populus x berolinensis]|nr:hypothetical protein NC651_033401 [Populus alba x Populus x berolinensis]